MHTVRAFPPPFLPRDPNCLQLPHSATARAVIRAGPRRVPGPSDPGRAQAAASGPAALLLLLLLLPEATRLLLLLRLLAAQGLGAAGLDARGALPALGAALDGDAAAAEALGLGHAHLQQPVFIAGLDGLRVCGGFVCGVCVCVCVCVLAESASGQ